MHHKKMKMKNQIEYLAKNKPIRMGFILKMNDIPTDDLNATEYRLHRPEKCACQCIKFEFSTTKENLSKVESIFSRHGISETNIEESLGNINCSFTISSLSLRNKFHNLYKDFMPSVLEYYKVSEKENELINLLLYKEKDVEEIQIEQISKDLCKFTRENNSKIIEALLIQKANSIWYVEGIGCSCSTFSPLNPASINKANLLVEMNKY